MTASYNHVESQEMYLKVISKIMKRKKYVLAVDVSAESGYAKSSVSRALSILERDGYIYREQNRTINFTEKGNEVVDFLEDRFRVLSEIFMQHGLSKIEAESTACEIEHFITRDVYEKLKKSF